MPTEARALETVRLLRRGRQTEVHLLVEPESRRLFAGKALREELRGDRRLAKHFRGLVSEWMGLGEHPHIVRTLRAHEVEGRYSAILQYVSPDFRGRRSVGDHLRHIAGPLDLPQVLAWSLQFCEGMLHAYGRGVRAHLDVTPENLLVTREGCLKITDFGPRTFYQPPGGPMDDLRATRCLVGTPHYLPPEVLEGEEPDGTADVYGLGAVLWQMASGSPVPPFRAHADPTEPRLAGLIKSKKSLDLGRVDAPLRSVIAKSLAWEPGERFRNLSDLRSDLQRLAAGVKCGSGRTAPHGV